jgi:carbon storage regulator
MLVLSRKADEYILIGDDISIAVLAIQGNQVKIGIQAPRDIEILREELVIDTAEKEYKRLMRNKNGK